MMVIFVKNHEKTENGKAFTGPLAEPHNKSAAILVLVKKKQAGCPAQIDEIPSQ